MHFAYFLLLFSYFFVNLFHFSWSDDTTITPTKKTSCLAFGIPSGVCTSIVECPLGSIFSNCPNKVDVCCPMASNSDYDGPCTSILQASGTCKLSSDCPNGNIFSNCPFGRVCCPSNNNNVNWSSNCTAFGITSGTCTNVTLSNWIQTLTQGCVLGNCQASQVCCPNKSK